MKKFLLRIALVLCTAAVLCGCGEPAPSEPTVSTTAPTQPGKATYEVTVTDALGNPYTSSVIVKFMLNGEQVSMLPVNANGMVSKELDVAEYTVELVQTGDAVLHYDAAAAVFAAGQTKLNIVLSKTVDTSKPTMLYALEKENTAYGIETGCTYTELTPGERNFFIFTPAEAGTYEFRAMSADVQIGYYGAPHFVQDLSAAEVVDNIFVVSISASMIGTESSGTVRLVIGVDAGSADSCVLAITRIGNAQVTISDYPWHVYQPTAKLNPYTLPQGATLKDFDITAASAGYTLVLNEQDGFYHLNSADGPLVLVRLGANSAYMAGYQKVLETAGVVKYFFDENGEFVKKESYSDCLISYIGCMDPNEGVYPLTEDLKYIIQQNGDHCGWWNAEASTYLFRDAAGNPVAVREDIAWLFMCCYLAG